MAFLRRKEAMEGLWVRRGRQMSLLREVEMAEGRLLLRQKQSLKRTPWVRRCPQVPPLRMEEAMKLRLELRLEVRLEVRQQPPPGGRRQIRHSSQSMKRLICRHRIKREDLLEDPCKALQ
mmetsp:Transcript_24615/g.54843  ORF Transcript_24615/g.54843 Transcript_24615/m.54843 type:complete len:120 (+) Transcript_24615:519-878(+)